MSLNNLATAIHARYQETGMIDDLGEAIRYLRETLDLCPPGHPERSSALNNLASTMMARFERVGEIGDLDEAIMYHSEALGLRPPGHPDRSISLNNLASAVHDRFEESGRIEDLNEAIAYHRQALDLVPSEHHDRSNILSNLGLAICDQFRNNGRIEDLEEAIAYLQETLELRPVGNSNRSTSLNNLGSIMRTRFEQTADMKDLEKAITYHTQALDLRPQGNPDRPTSLNNLAAAIHHRFDRTGQIEDLEKVIACHREALGYRPPGIRDRAFTLNNLGLAIHTRFTQSGRMEDLEEAIACLRKAVNLRSPGSPERPNSLNILGRVIHDSFEQTERMEDLENAIRYLRQALDICPAESPDRYIFLNHLASALQSRFERKQEVNDIAEAFEHHHQALALCPPGHPGRSGCLDSLATAIHDSFRLTGNLEDLDEVISFSRQALDLLPPGHSDRPAFLNNLGASLHSRFARTSRIEDLDGAEALLSDAVTSLPAHHPMLTHIGCRLAAVHLKQYELSRSSQQLSKAFALFEQSTNNNTASSKARLVAAFEWMSAAKCQNHESTVRAYSMSLILLNRCLVATPSVELQQKFLASISIPKSLAMDAASSAIERGQLDTAVELLEQGRNILWTRMRGYRQPLDELREVDRELAEEFESLSDRLERYAMSSETNSKAANWQMDFRGTSLPFEVRQQRFRILSEKWNKTVKRIRQIKGFANFLDPVPFTALRHAAVEGPVIIVNVSDYRSDAIIIRNIGLPILVQLPNARCDKLTQLASEFSDTSASRAVDSSAKLSSILRCIWDIIVGPVTHQLIALGIPQKSRIWWCPTSDVCSIPLHAAGPYSYGRTDLPDIFVSSYTSTLSALIKARSGMTSNPSKPNILVIAQPETLPNVEEEVRRIIKYSSLVNVLVGEEANRQTVISGLQQHSWAHFACHGNRNREPFLSSFLLHGDERLTLIDIITAQLPNAEHAFLSACYAAAADSEETPDEVLHLTAALQFCGFRSVVGTLWTMADIDGPDVADDFYRYMFREHGNVADFRDSATALNFATNEMRKRHVAMDRWVNFVHYGA
jgi:tetratricopeptide (TPR) repeat protein